MGGRIKYVIQGKRKGGENMWGKRVWKSANAGKTFSLLASLERKPNLIVGAQKKEK